MKRANWLSFIVLTICFIAGMCGTLAPPDLSDDIAADVLSTAQVMIQHKNSHFTEAENLHNTAAATQMTTDAVMMTGNEAQSSNSVEMGATNMGEATVSVQASQPPVDPKKSASDMAVGSAMADPRKGVPPAPAGAQVQTSWVLRTKKVRECKRVIKIVRQPKQVCGWEVQDVCKKVPHRQKAYRFDCDADHYCHKVAFYKTTYTDNCKKIKKRVCKKWNQVQRVPQRICADKVQRLKCLKAETCTNHKKCLKWVNQETGEGFKYRQCLRWIQFRRCGVSYSECTLLHEADDKNF